MLPLTRNIFRQTATSFNNTTKRWKTGKPLHPDKMVKFCCLWIIEKFTFTHQQNNNVAVGNQCCCARPRWKRMTYDTFWWTQVLDIRCQWCYDWMTKRCIWIFFSRHCFTLKHFCYLWHPGEKSTHNCF